MIRLLAALLAVCLATCSPAPALAAVAGSPPIAVAPAAIVAAIDAARPGDTLRLSGDFGRITIKGRSFAPALTIDATGATVRGVVLDGVDGVVWTGGRVTGNGTTDLTSPTGYGITVRLSARIAVARVDVSRWARGIVVDRSTDVAVTASWLHALRTDGIDIALSQRVTIDGNALTDFVPNAAYTDASGVWHDGDHPDGIQAYSRPGGIVADVAVTNNIVVGTMQGIFFGNHVRDGVDDGGFDRVRITGNVVRVTFTGLSLNDCRACTVQGNTVAPLTGALYKVRLLVQRATGSFCGNRVPDLPTVLGGAACPP